jgi:undecaprenyl pyrophosphate synthase
MQTSDIPVKQDFMMWSPDEIAQYAPKTVCFVPGGTRRAAALAGIPPDDTHAYINYGFKELLRCCKLMFDHGVEHLFCMGPSANHKREGAKIWDLFFQSMVERFLSPEAVNFSAEEQLRVRFLGYYEGTQTEEATLRQFIDALQQKTNAAEYKKTLWLYFCPGEDLFWRWITKTVHEHYEDVTRGSQQDLITALCGENVPPAELFLSFGKMIIGLDFLPAILIRHTQCYWAQSLSLRMDERQWREILYDFAFVRKTWQSDKASRAQEALIHPRLWEENVVLGVGQRIGPFWYPTPIADIASLDRGLKQS